VGKSSKKSNTALKITMKPLPHGKVQRAYSASLTAAGGWPLTRGVSCRARCPQAFR
jgi:hypothetical protein